MTLLLFYNFSSLTNCNRLNLGTESFTIKFHVALSLRLVKDVKLNARTIINKLHFYIL